MALRSTPASGTTAGSNTASRRSPEEKLVTSLITLMESGTTPWRRPWDASTGGHHINLLSGRRYRGGNPALLSFGMHLRGSTLPYWCGFAEARAHGLAPRRGSQAVHVLRPQLLQQPTGATPDGPAAAGPVADSGGATGDGITAGSGDPGRPATDPGSTAAGDRPRLLYRPVPLFNVADLEGEALGALIQARQSAAVTALRPEPERLHAAEAVLCRWPVAVRHGGDQACYLPQVDRIHLPDRAAFHSAAALCATWAHEAIHSTGHTDRLARDLSGVMGAAGGSGRAYAREELVAELGAVLLGDRLEIGSDTCNHAAYLSHWIALLRDTPRLLLQVLGDARRAADLIWPEPETATTPADESATLAGEAAGETSAPGLHA